MCTTSILAVHNFTDTFVLEGDVSRKGLGVVLMQDGRPLSFISKQLCDKILDNSTYEKEMMVILHVVNTWLLYLIRWRFQIKLDHHSLEYFLEQRLTSLEKHKWVRKMLGYDYKITYKKRKDCCGRNGIKETWGRGIPVFLIVSSTGMVKISTTWMTNQCCYILSHQVTFGGSQPF